MTDLPRLLADVVADAASLLASDERARADRARLASSLARAHEAGASYSLLGRLAGMSRQAVTQAIERGK